MTETKQYALNGFVHLCHRGRFRCTGEPPPPEAFEVFGLINPSRKAPMSKKKEIDKIRQTSQQALKIGRLYANCKACQRAAMEFWLERA